jgi:hypothetical protein
MEQSMAENESIYHRLPWSNPLTNFNRAKLALFLTGKYNPETAAKLFYVEEFCYQLASLLTYDWREFSQVHTSLTSLAHNHLEHSFTLVWHDDLTLGLKYSDTYIRDFHRGMAHSNILIVCQQPLIISMTDYEHFRTFQRDAEGFSYLARMFAEIFIVSAFQGVVFNLDDRDVGDQIKAGFAFALLDFGFSLKGFTTTWDNNNWNSAVTEVAEAASSNILRLVPIARIASRFVMAIEGLDGGEKYDWPK